MTGFPKRISINSTLSLYSQPL